MDKGQLKEIIGKFREIEQICGSVSSLEYELECLIEAHRLLLTEYVPFKVGDRVELSQTPEIPSDSGWACSKHFLVEGAAGEVKSSEVTSTGNIWYNVEFDDESWVDRNGVVLPVSTKHTYHFKKELLRLHTEAPRRLYRVVNDKKVDLQFATREAAEQVMATIPAVLNARIEEMDV